MVGPFPGMDPYLENQGAWPDFHNSLIAEIRNELGVRLPDSYIARVEERIEIAASEPDLTRSFVPDVMIGQFEIPDNSPGLETSTELTATIAPTFVELLDREFEEVRVTWVEVRALPDLELVTAVEVLSPVNKSWQGRQSYLEKRVQLHASRVNLVEIDLLLGGTTVPLKQRITPGLYNTIVARGNRWPMAEVYCWTIRDPLPRIPIPLRGTDRDIVIDLGNLVRRVYDLGRYSRTLHHDQPLPESTPISPADRIWIEEHIRSGDKAKPT